MDDDLNTYQDADDLVASGGGTRRGLVFGIVIALAIAGLVPFLLGGGFRGSQPYEDVMEAASQDRQVVFELGEPIKQAGIITGEISTGGISGQADMRIPVRGPDGRGVLYVAGRRENGVWTYYTFAAEIRETGQIIELRPPR